MPKEDPIAVVEAGYRLELDEPSWLRGLAKAASSLDRGLGVAAYSVDTDGTGFSVRHLELVPERLDVREHAEQLQDGLPRGVAAQLHRDSGFYGCWTSHEILPDFSSRYYAARRGPVRDFWAVQGICASGRSVVVGAPLAEAARVSPAVRPIWSMVAVHLAAALRLRRALEQSAPIDEAVLSPDGRCLHALGRARSASARERLRDAANAIDRARGRLRRRPAEALETWNGLFSGRWSLVDVFESDGRRLLVARPNEPQAAKLRRLTRRERQVVSLAALGQPDKLIGYGLGLAESTVRTHLRRAMSKMGIRSRLDLVKAASLLDGRSDDGAS